MVHSVYLKLYWSNVPATVWPATSVRGWAVSFQVCVFPKVEYATWIRIIMQIPRPCLFQSCRTRLSGKQPGNYITNDIKDHGNLIMLSSWGSHGAKKKMAKVLIRMRPGELFKLQPVPRIVPALESQAPEGKSHLRNAQLSSSLTKPTWALRTSGPDRCLKDPDRGLLNGTRFKGITSLWPPGNPHPPSPSHSH